MMKNCEFERSLFTLRDPAPLKPITRSATPGKTVFDLLAKK